MCCIAGKFTSSVTSGKNPITNGQMGLPIRNIAWDCASIFPFSMTVLSPFFFVNRMRALVSHMHTLSKLPARFNKACVGLKDFGLLTESHF